jgi:hypothetical protein
MAASASWGRGRLIGDWLEVAGPRPTKRRSATSLRYNQLARVVSLSSTRIEVRWRAYNVELVNQRAIVLVQQVPSRPVTFPCFLT